MTGTRAGGAALCVPGVPGVPTGSGTTGGRLPQRPEAGRGAMARAPELSVSQPSAGQVTVSTAYTTRSPTDPAAAIRQRFGVAAAEMSLQSRPGMPTNTTGCGPVWRAPVTSVLARTRTGAPARCAPEAAVAVAPPAAAACCVPEAAVAVAPPGAAARCTPEAAAAVAVTALSVAPSSSAQASVLLTWSTVSAGSAGPSGHLAAPGAQMASAMARAHRR